METKNELALFILDYVKTHSITISDLARDMDVPHSTVARWARGKTEPTIKQLSKLANATNTDLCTLVELIVPNSRRDVSPQITRIAERIDKLPVSAQELLDSVIRSLSLQRDK